MPLQRYLLILFLGLWSLTAPATERVTYYHHDALGSPVAATDQNGRLLWRESYKPYGERLHRVADREPGYTGKFAEADFGIQYFGARWYDPAVGRFLAVDPVGFDPQNPQTFNRYAYANNNPYGFVDPDGRAPKVPYRPLLDPGIGGGSYGMGYGSISRAPTPPRATVQGTAESGGGNRGTVPSSGGAKYGPLNPGPLAQDVAKTFRSGTYTGRTLSSDQTLYRVISENGNPNGSYWTTVKPQGPLKSVIDSALDQNWGNTATRVVTAKVPAGTTVYEGAAAAQRGLVGGGNQVYILKVDPSWVVP